MKLPVLGVLRSVVVAASVWGAATYVTRVPGDEGVDADLRVIARRDPTQFLAVYTGPFKIMSALPNIDCNAPGNGSMQGETSVAINPKNPNIVIAGANDDRSNHSSPSQYVYLSTDGGATWINKAMPSGSPIYSACTDPSLAYDANGVAYFGYGQFDPRTNGPSAVTIQRSMDGGFNWDSPVIIAANTSGTLEDKYIIAADAFSNSPYKNNVYVSWTHFVNIGTGNQTDDIWFSRSTNQGQTWTASPLVVSTSGRGHLSMPAVGPSGEVYVVWSEKGNGQSALMIARSGNGGASFSSPSVITGGPVWSMPDTLGAKGGMRMITYPVIAVDNSTVHPGRVYVTWAGRNGAGGIPHIFMTYSDNAGVSWSAARIMDDDMTSGQDKFHPWIAVDPKSGAVALTFYDSRNDFQNRQADLYISISRDGGRNFDVQRVSNTSFGVNPTSGYWADYQCVAAYKGKVIPCWTDQRSGGSVFNTDVYVSMIGLGPNTVSNLTAAVSESSPTSISLTWRDPTTTLAGDPMPSFNVVIYRDSQVIASVPKGTLAYQDNNLQTGSYHTYQLYVAVGTDTSSVATAAGYAGGALQPEAPVLLSARETIDGTELRWKNPTKHIDGTALYDLGAVFFYVDGNRSQVGQLPSDTGKIVTKLVNMSQAQLKKFHTFSLTVASQRTGIVTQSVKSDSMMWYAGAPTTTINESFESSPVIGTNGGWTTTTLGAHAGTKSLCDNNVGKTQSSLNIFAMLPPVVVQANAKELSFWHAAIVASVDSAIAEFTNDHGQTWKPIGRYNQASGGFSDSIKTATWKNVTFNMGAYVGDTIVVRFRMRSSSLKIHKQGWFIDEVTLRAPTAVTEPVALPSLPLLVSAAPNPFTVSSVITSDGFDLPRDATSVSLKVYDVTGREVADLTPQVMAAGSVHARFDAAGHPAGTYIARLRVGSREGWARFLLQR